MKMFKQILWGTACWLFLSIGVQAQQAYRTVPHVLEAFEKGNLSVDQAYIQMNEIYNDGTIHKCSTPLHMFQYKHKNEISSGILRQTETGAYKSAMSTYISASGKFEFTYETAGDNAVPSSDTNTNGIPDYVEEAAIAADSSYNYLIQTLGYTDPIPNGTTYSIKILELGDIYGQAISNGGSGSGPISRIEIENDFVGFPENNDPDGDQLGALRVTIAHEFKHAIQFVQENSDAFDWAEMDATLAEEIVYDVVNDYYNYLNGFGDVFGSPGVTVIPGSYEDVTWALYFHEKYGSDFWPATWERIENSITNISFLFAIEEELASRGENYIQALQELYTWHFASGSFSNINFGFDENLFYPTPNVQSNITEVNDQFSSTINQARFAAYMTNVVPPGSQTGDASVLMDADSVGLSLAVVALFDNGTVELEFGEEDSGFMVVSKGWKWDEIERLGVIVFNERENKSGKFRIKISDTFVTSIPSDNVKPTTTELKQNYPNPFNPSTTIPVSISEFQRVKIDIYDMAGRLVQSVFDGNLSNGNYAIPVNMERFASGVYMYRLQTNDDVQIKRMTLVK